MALFTVDRIIDGKAVLLLRSNETVDKEVAVTDLPREVKEGDIIDVSFSNDNITIETATIQTDATKAAKQKANELLQKILDKNK